MSVSDTSWRVTMQDRNGAIEYVHPRVALSSPEEYWGVNGTLYKLHWKQDNMRECVYREVVR